MNNNKEFIPYTLALKLKELGFNLPTMFFWFPDFEKKQLPQSLVEYNDNQTFHLEYGKNYIGINEKDVETLHNEGLFQLTIPAPLWQQAFEWLRDKYDYLYLITDTQVSASDTIGYRFRYQIWKLMNDELYIDDESFLGYYSYDEAQQACLEAIIEDLIKTNNDENKS